MNKPTFEELILQILATCLLINSQMKWHAHFTLFAHCGLISVHVQPADTDYQAPQRPRPDSRDAKFTGTLQRPDSYLTEAQSRQQLIDMLAWTQSYLSMEAAA
ncbi:hypothetical protein QO209_10740 [Pseudomonas citronellolis]|uniref:hypothetical protein n=1 Tax=Pseudomonas citronellolis TaxID=53408 RepID=UPI002648387A|nr:hypothetical protein [Pseudomonas citronellolis]MDN6872922.1 hypothetical protein [Pseudomonas citronellolis]